MKHPDTAILIFAKAPVAGEVKTRLAPPLSLHQAACLHAELTRGCLRKCSTANLCDVQLWCSPDTSHPFFVECEQRYPVSLHRQTGHDLGERMSSALHQMQGRYRKLIIIGTDAPALDIGTIDEVAAALNETDVVLVPAEDGGYVLLGAATYRTGLLADVPWGTSSVLSCTVRNLDGLGLAYSLHGQCWDVDRPADLERYRSMAPIMNEDGKPGASHGSEI